VNRCTSRSCRVNVVRKQISFIETDAEFLQFAQAVTREPYSAVLLSGGALTPQDENRYSMVAWDPYLVFQSKETSCTLRTCKNEFIHSGDPLQKLDELFNSFQPNFPLVCTPFSGGAIGYIAYDLKNRLEKLPQTAHDDLHLPDLLFFWPRQFLVFDRALKRADLLIFQYETDPYSASTNVLDFEIEVRKPEPFIVGPLRSNFKHLEYIDAVRRVRRYIRQGDVYQVNLSQRYQFPLQGDSFQLWRSLFELNPAPFYAFIQAGGHQVLSTSMERFLFRRGRYMETRPIKGTRKRGANP
jgi:para-aminobenzoate synthetase component I